MRRDAPVVTTAPLTLEQERTIRQHRYMWTMGGRTAMFIIAVAVPMPLLARLGLLVASMVVPWLAVMAANQPHRRVQGRAVVGYAAPPPVSEPLPLEATRVIEGDLG